MSVLLKELRKVQGLIRRLDLRSREVCFWALLMVDEVNYRGSSLSSKISTKKSA